MKQLVCNIKPFDNTQTIYLIEDKKVLKNFKINTSSFNEKIISLGRDSSLEIDKIVFKGHKKYSLGIKDQIKKIEKSKYLSNNLTIEVI